MENIVEYMKDYIWVLVIAILVILALIGYIADKTNFINKQNGRKDSKDDKENLSKQKVEIMPNLNKGINDAYTQTTEEKKEEKPINDDIFASIKPSEEKAEDVPSDLYTPLENKVEDNLTSEIPSELYAPISDYKQDNNDDSEPVINTKQDYDSNNSEQVLDFSGDDSEIWKF